MPPRWLCGNSAIENVLHYPRPIVDEAVIATNPEPSNLLNRRKLEEPKTKEEAPARDKKDSDVISVAKADTAKRKSEMKYRPEKLAHLTPKAGRGLFGRPRLFRRIRIPPGIGCSTMTPCGRRQSDPRLRAVLYS